jgi:hypothetical protein
MTESLGRWVVAAAITVIAVATLSPSSGTESSSSLCNVCGEQGGVDAALNVLMFVPLGVGLALLRLRAPFAIGLVVSCTLSVEVLQILVVPGRDASLGDILMNSLGGTLGFVIGRHVHELVRPGRANAVRLAMAWLAIWLFAQAASAYAFVPVLPDPPYFAQVGRPASFSRVAFPGKVLSAHVGPETLSGGALRNAARVKELLARREGVRSDVVVQPGGSVDGRAELVVISGPEMVGVLSFEQDGGSFIFGQRTGAKLLRLRPFEYRLSGVFDGSPPGSNPDTLRVHAQYGPGEVVVGSASRGRQRESRFVPRQSQGWMLLSPVTLYVDDDVAEFGASMAFLCFLIMPAGYWASLGWSDAGDRRSRNVALLSCLALVLVAGLVAIPLALGLHAAAPWEWACVLTGVVLGAALGQRVNTAS